MLIWAKVSSLLSSRPPDGCLLLKLRPQLSAQSEWEEAIAWFNSSMPQAEKKEIAPPGPLVRAISGKPKQERDEQQVE